MYLLSRRGLEDRTLKFRTAPCNVGGPRPHTESLGWPRGGAKTNHAHKPNPWAESPKPRPSAGFGGGASSQPALLQHGSAAVQHLCGGGGGGAAAARGSGAPSWGHGGGGPVRALPNGSCMRAFYCAWTVRGCQPRGRDSGLESRASNLGRWARGGLELRPSGHLGVGRGWKMG